VSALPYIPSVFSPGDRLHVNMETQVRDHNGRWACWRPSCPYVLSDTDVRRLYTDPDALTRFGVPLLAPSPVEEDQPLPGQPVAVGENPFEADRPYLMAGPRTDSGGEFTALVTESSPWGPAQRTVIPKAPTKPTAWTYEMTLTETGVVWYRAYGLPVAYIPAELPTGDDVVNLLTAAVLRAASPGGFPWRRNCRS
jgi:hypothetical protein